MQRSLCALTLITLATSSLATAHAETQTNPAETSVLEVQVVKRKAARVIYDREFYFAAGSSSIDTHGRRTLQTVRDLLAKRPNRKVVIEGFSDASGTEHTRIATCSKRTDAAFLELLVLGADQTQLLRKVRGLRELSPRQRQLPRSDRTTMQRAVRVRVVEL